MCGNACTCIEISKINFEKWFKNLIRFNYWLFILHSILIGGLVLGGVLYSVINHSQKMIPVTTSKLDGRPGYGNYSFGHELYKINTQWLVLVFCIVTGFFHLFYYVKSEWYLQRILMRNNYYRWCEYSFTASLMIVIISQVTGITDLNALLNAFGCAFGMIWFGQYTEITEDLFWRRMAFVFGSISGVFPWISIFVTYGLSPAEKPAFVTVIVIGQFFQFMSFAGVRVWMLVYDDPIVQKQEEEKALLKGVQDAVIQRISKKGVRVDTEKFLQKINTNQKRYLVGEMVLNFLSLSTKAYLAITLFSANS